MAVDTQNFVAYVDLLGIGDASLGDGDSYYDQLRRFRLALCDAVDRHLDKSDEVFAFSDCAFANSSSLDRLGSYLARLQYVLWDYNIFLKGAISQGERDHFEFAALPKQSKEIVADRKRKLHGYWFPKAFVYPALLEKNLKGVAIQVHGSVSDEKWLEVNTTTSAYFPTDATKKPIVIRDIRIPEEHLPALNNLLKTYMLMSHGSRRVSRYYVPLIVTWIKSYDYSKIGFDSRTSEYSDIPLPVKHLVFNPKIAFEVTALVGGDVIFYSLLAKIAVECQVEKLTAKVFDYIAGNKRLRAAAEHIPDEICPLLIRQRMIDTRIHHLFKTGK
ncbi:hypothetical protein [Hydrogenophaga taeniospiralis]|uniref:hypothetical protein n=1 Tax=Hydrogenophaga taeniospiralis TaxID=65656 RepID=UPI000ACE22C0|nr:hypothetical protein [Hydrogenophaga taeniospiralis]